VGNGLSRTGDLFQKCIQFFVQGRFDDAYDCFSQCISLDKELAPAYSIRAAVDMRRGRPQHALDDITEAINLVPGNPGYIHNRAVVLAAIGRIREAIQEYEKVLDIDPSSSGTLNNLAWLFTNAPDPSMRDCRKAIEYAKRAVEANRSGAWLDTLAAAHAECGEFEMAIKIEKEAFAKSNHRNQAFKQRLELYGQGISYARQRFGK